MLPPRKIQGNARIIIPLLLVTLLLAGAFIINDFKKLANKGADAYVYALPLVLMDITRQETFKHPAASSAQPNRFYMIPILADHTFRTVVRPNVDTLYSIAWLDLTEEPLLLTVPASRGRYHVEQFMDAWTNVFFAPGIRTLGDEMGKYLITSRNWRGDIPKGYTRIDAPTDMVWILARVFVDGEDDLTAARRYQASLDVRPLSRRGDPNYKPILPDERGRGAKRSDPIDIVRSMSADEFFSRFIALTKHNPPASEDQAFIDDVLRPLQLTQESATDWNSRSSYTRRAIEKGIETVWSVMTHRAAVEKDLTPTGWAGLANSTNIGIYGTNYPLRAGVAVFGLGANMPEDAIYLNASVDGEGEPLQGGKSYTLTFPSGQLPPVNGFWSVTLYDHKGYLLESPTQRYNLRQSDPLTYNADGSLTLLIQPDPPANRKLEHNWLPSPKTGQFVLSMRLYWPEQALLDGKWIPPALIPHH